MGRSELSRALTRPQAQSRPRGNRWDMPTLLALLLILPAIGLVLLAPNVFADIADTRMSSYVGYSRLRWAVISIALVALFVRRGLPWPQVAGYSFVVLGLLGSISRNFEDRMDLTLSFGAVLVGLLILAYRLISTPHIYEENVQLRARVKELEEKCGEGQ